LGKTQDYSKTTRAKRAGGVATECLEFKPQNHQKEFL
jgi:hypothetical protein